MLKKNKKITMSYSQAIREATHFLLKKNKNFLILGQGVTSPWYVGNSMLNLNNLFPNQVIDTPVSENLITGTGLGLVLNNMKCMIVHPRMDFMLYAMDQIINQISKWNFLNCGKLKLPLVIRGIINRGGSQGAQHSQSLHSVFSHFPGLRVVMPSSPEDAYQLLIASINSNDPVIFIDDAWLYKNKQSFLLKNNLNLNTIKPKIKKRGKDITVVSAGFFANMALDTSKILKKKFNIEAEIIDLRVLNPFYPKIICNSFKKTGRLLVIDGGHINCGFGNNIIAEVFKNIEKKNIKILPQLLALPNYPAPSAKEHELKYYPSQNKLLKKILNLCDKKLIKI